VRATFSRERKTPAALIAPRDGRVTWFADRAAASRLDPSSDTDFS
jgi:hypothetical protein